MYNLFKTFHEISSYVMNLEAIEGIETYYAHLKEENHSVIHRETLVEHTNCIKSLFLKGNQIYEWDTIIDRLIQDIWNHTSFESSVFKQEKIQFAIGNLCKLFFLDAILFHDYGKLNPNFQKNKMKSQSFSQTNCFNNSSEHALLSSILYLNYYTELLVSQLVQISDNGNFELFNNLQILNQEERKQICEFLFVILTLLSITIKHHHSKQIKDIQSLLSSYDRYSCKDYKIFKDILPIQFSYCQDLFISLKNIDLKNIFTNQYNYISLFFFIKIQYSILNMIDYLATTQYYTQLQIDLQNSIFNSESKKKLYKDFYCISYNQILLKSKKEIQEYINNTQIDAFNRIRTQMALEVKNNITQNYSNHLFYLQAPTGAGKTNLSLLADIELLQHRKELKRIFYILPFNTLSDQIYDFLKQHFSYHYQKGKIFQIHNATGLLSNIEFQNQEEREEADAQYGKEKKLYLDYLFLNFPILVLSHVRFFNIIKSNYKQENYPFSQLANSIVILDEIQSYPPKEWDKLKFFIENISYFFNICFIIMSATLPRIHSIEIKNKKENYKDLIEQPEKYFQDSLFKNRVQFDFQLWEKTYSTIKDLLDSIVAIISRNIQIYPKPLKIVIEFITKKSANEFYQIAKEHPLLNQNFKIFLLSGTILPPIRKHILKEIQNSKDNIFLITTQVIEAGIDLDFDFGFKDIAILDSEEQLAGRINRNARKTNAILYLFSYSKENFVYKNDFRLKVLKNIHSKKKFYQKILQEKNFHFYYEQVIGYINQQNKSKFTENFNDFMEKIKKLDFSYIHNNFSIIPDRTISIFIPIVLKSTDFSSAENEFLKKHIQTYRENISGKEIWELYISFFRNPLPERKILFQEISSIVSKFIIHLYCNESLIQYLKRYVNTKYLSYTSILYLEKYQEIYSKESGLNLQEIESMTL